MSAGLGVDVGGFGWVHRLVTPTFDSLALFVTNIIYNTVHKHSKIYSEVENHCIELDQQF